MSNELTTVNNSILSIDEVDKIASKIATTNILGTRNINEVFSLLMLARSQGVDVIKVAMEYHIIDGTPSVKTKAAQSRFQASGGKIKYLETTDKVCKAEFTHPKGSDITIEWTWERASKIISYFGKDSKPKYLIDRLQWKNYPAEMLRARCISAGVRACYPACLDNLYTTDEVEGWKETVIDVKAESNTVEVVKNDIDNSVYNKATDTFQKDFSIHPKTKQAFSELEDEKLKLIYNHYLNTTKLNEVDKEGYLKVLTELMKSRNLLLEAHVPQGDGRLVHVSEDKDVYENIQDENWDKDIEASTKPDTRLCTGSMEVKGFVNEKGIPF